MSVRPEVVLLLGAAGVGLLGLLFPLLLRQNDAPQPIPWLRLAVAGGVIALLFGLTRLREYPFSPGGTLGNGLVMGGVFAVVTVALAVFWPASASTVGASGGALLGGALVLLGHRGYPNAALVGFGAGHALATFLATVTAGGEEEEGRGHSGLWAGPVMAATLAGAVLLAIDRAEEMAPAERLALDGKVWWIWPAVVMAAALAGQMIGRTLFARRAWGSLSAGLFAALLLLLLWLRFPHYAPLMGPPAAGFVTALLMLAVVRGEREPGTSSSIPSPSSLLPALLAPALVLLLLATAYRLYTGYGIALAALGAVVLLPWLAEREPRAVGRSLFGLLAAAILFRVYYNSYDLRSSDIPLTAHYAMVSLLAGALAPFAFAALNGRWNRGQSPAFGRPPSVPVTVPSGSGLTADRGWRMADGACLAAAVGLPVLLALFWGQKAGGGLLLGLVIGQGYRMMTALLEGQAPGRAGAIAAGVPEAAPLVMAWITVQLLDRVTTYGLQLLRVQRVGLIAALVAVCFLAILYGERSASMSRGAVAERA